MQSLRDENARLRDELEELENRFIAVMDFLSTPIWKAIVPDLFEKAAERLANRKAQ